MASATLGYGINSVGVAPRRQSLTRRNARSLKNEWLTPRSAIKKSHENARNPYLIFGISYQCVSPSIDKNFSSGSKALF